MYDYIAQFKFSQLEEISDYRRISVIPDTKIYNSIEKSGHILLSNNQESYLKQLKENGQHYLKEKGEHFITSQKSITSNCSISQQQYPSLTGDD